MNTPSGSLKNTPRLRQRRRRLVLRLFLFIALILVILLAWPVVQSRSPILSGLPSPSGALSVPGVSVTRRNNGSPIPSQAPTKTPSTITITPTETPTPNPSPTSDATTTQEDPASAGLTSQADTLIISLRDGGSSHLYAYHPERLPLTRLMDGPWSDIAPAVSPDGLKVAFSSNRTGKWDLFTLDLSSGDVFQVTDSQEYDGAPSWSPDGLWLAYETYIDNNLEIMVRPVAGDQPAIRLTNHPAADYHPVWSPQGRQIAFVSARDGGGTIWIADLDQPGESRFRRLSLPTDSEQTHPAWSPDGTTLAWVSHQDRIRSLYVTNIHEPGMPSHYIGGGDWPVWASDGKTLLSRSTTPNRTYLVGYATSGPGEIRLPAFALPGSLEGLSGGAVIHHVSLPQTIIQAANLTPTANWYPALTLNPEVPGGRRQLVDLEEVQAPYPQLHDLVDESFRALRVRLGREIGWDMLSSLENAFVPLTAPLPPGMGYDWLYTGRAITFNMQPASAGWMVFVREDYGADTYWRVYLRPLIQDGSQGRPLYETPWDLGARYSGNPAAYEQGGALLSGPLPGYWYDFTSLALAYGWERLPALPNWRTFYPGSRANELALTSGLDWRAAMLELYPPEILITPTAIVPPSQTPTPTPRWYRTPTPTITATPIPTFTPAWTPAVTHSSP